jgi:hypothetical protein
VPLLTTLLKFVASPGVAAGRTTPDRSARVTGIETRAAVMKPPRVLE